MVKIALLILAAIFFGLDALKVTDRINWTPAGFCVLVIALCLI
ncbi:MAG: hypothetical protein ABR954_10600 [Dehalococcoidales bacterium]